MKFFTIIFAIVGLVVSFFVSSLLFTRFELVEVAQNHHVLYEKQQNNVDFDTWLEQTQTKIGDTQMSLFYLDELSLLIYPSQKSEVKQLVKASQELLAEYEQLLNALEIEVDHSPSFKKIWEITFLNNASKDSADVMQKLFQNLPNLISDLQDNMVIIETQQKIIQASQALAIKLNKVLKDNQIIGKTFMLDSFAALPDNIWLNEAIPSIEEADSGKAEIIPETPQQEEATRYYERKLEPTLSSPNKQPLPNMDATPSADELLKELNIPDGYKQPETKPAKKISPEVKAPPTSKDSELNKPADKAQKPESKAAPTVDDIKTLEPDSQEKPSKQKTGFVET